MAGKFIAVYGINNIGKSTHCKKLVRRLEKEGYKAFYVKYPVYDLKPSGPYINSALRGGINNLSEEELQMWFVLNRYQFQPKLKQLLEDGYIVVAEDYVGTGIAWGTAKGLSENWLIDVNKNLLKEDFSIMLHGIRDVRAKEKGHVHENNDELVEKCEAVHNDLSKKYGWKNVKVQKKMADTAKLVWDAVKNEL